MFFPLTLHSNNAYEISLKINNEQPLGLNDMYEPRLLINSRCYSVILKKNTLKI